MAAYASLCDLILPFESVAVFHFPLQFSSHRSNLRTLRVEFDAIHRLSEPEKTTKKTNLFTSYLIDTSIECPWLIDWNLYRLIDWNLYRSIDWLIGEWLIILYTYPVVWLLDLAWIIKAHRMLRKLETVYGKKALRQLLFSRLQLSDVWPRDDWRIWNKKKLWKKKLHLLEEFIIYTIYFENCREEPLKKNLSWESPALHASLDAFAVPRDRVALPGMRQKPRHGTKS